MRFVWAGKRNLINTKLIFTLFLEKDCDTLKVCAADFFRVLADGKFLCYGPARTAAGYSRVKEIALPVGLKTLVVEVLGYNVSCFCCDGQFPFFGAEVFCEGKVIYSTCDFFCGRDLSYDRRTPKFSTQRGFMEKYNLNKKGVKKLKTYDVAAPVIIDGLKEVCNYEEIVFARSTVRPFTGFKSIVEVCWETRKEFFIFNKRFDVERDFIKVCDDEYSSCDFSLNSVRSGFVKIVVNAKSPMRIFMVMDELDINESGFRRSGCNDLIVIDVPAGTSTVTSIEPYSLKYMKAIYKGSAEIDATVITLENNRSAEIKIKGHDKLDTIVKAARHTFNQNVIDIFMDCPSRERAGWLCDSYFMGIAENLFMQNNNIERAFLENILIANIEELDKNMIPKCFPATHRNTAYYEGKNNLYIPNWAMFFVLELKEYFNRTGDKSLVDLAKDRVYGLIEFFDNFLNEHGLLENLEGWVFVEWSTCNDKNHLKGVNFPTNILYAKTLESIGEIYGDESLIARAQQIKNKIIEIGFDGEFFADNAVRVNGKLVRCADHLSETCQYYALFFGVKTEWQFKRKMMEEFGPMRKDDTYSQVGKSNMFIGYYLRFFWLLKEKENQRVIDETLQIFYPMATLTGTLWEHHDSHASCNHGFTSVIAVVLLRALLGFKEVKDGKLVFDENFIKNKENTFEIFYNNEKIY